MLWAPSGPTVTAVATTATQFVPTGQNNAGGVARVVNTGSATQTFTLGDSTVTATAAVPLTPGQDIVMAYGPGQTHIFASTTDIRITPGVGTMG